MRILHINDRGSLVGGVEQYIAEVAAALQLEGHQSYLVHFAPHDTRPIMADARPASLGEWPASADRARALIGEVITGFAPDVVYMHAVYHPGLVKWVGRRLPTVAYVHGPYLVCPGSAKYLRRTAQVCPHRAGLLCLLNAQTQHCCWGRNPLTHWRLLRRVRAYLDAYSEVQHIMVASSYMESLLCQAGLSESTIGILPPVLVQGTAPAPESAAEPRTVLFAGRLVPEKGLRYLIEALAEVRGPWRLVVAGDGEELEPCRALVTRLRVADRIRFAGWLDHVEMTAALQQCACVAVPSLCPEAFGRLGPEAFLYGRPVVAFAVGGVPDWLEGGVTGYLVTPGDIVGLRQALQRLLDSPTLRRRMGSYARQKAVSEWDRRVHVSKLVSALRAAISPPGSPSV